jgi:histidinol-phosphate/aromatic aminotransferase/cobyric acid decarboxylase-like protein
VGADNGGGGTGTDDLILLLAAVFLGEGKTAAIAPPTYPLYRIASQLHCARVVEGDGQADLRWVCNPNNPTGTFVEPEEVAELARSLPRTIVVCDEAYVEYGGRSVAPSSASTVAASAAPPCMAPAGVSTRGVSSSCQRFGYSVGRRPR